MGAGGRGGRRWGMGNAAESSLIAQLREVGGRPRRLGVRVGAHRVAGTPRRRAARPFGHRGGARAPARAGERNS